MYKRSAMTCRDVCDLCVCICVLYVECMSALSVLGSDLGEGVSVFITQPFVPECKRTTAPRTSSIECKVLWRDTNSHTSAAIQSARRTSTYTYLYTFIYICSIAFAAALTQNGCGIWVRRDPTHPFPLSNATRTSKRIIHPTIHATNEHNNQSDISIA